MNDSSMPHRAYTTEHPEADLTAFGERMAQRRSIRSFSDRDVPQAMIEAMIRIACSAPSGANKQPWQFIAVHSPELKKEIREGAEREERAFYGGRASPVWLRDLEPLGTDASKPFLETAPWLIAVFRRTQADDGGAVYYSHESVGLACGLLLAAAQEAGLATLIHTPSPMRFLNQILGRPSYEKPFLLIPVGWPAADARVPTAAIQRRPLTQSMQIRR